MRDADRFKLLYGPYHPPRPRPGRRLFCTLRGTVRVAAFSDGEIPWPLAKVRGSKGRGAFILCGDLVKALRRESSAAVQHWWGVTKWQVARWRRALGVDPHTEGTRALHRRLLPEKITPAVRAKAIRRGHDPVLLAELSRSRQVRGAPPTFGRRWKPAEDARLGAVPDAALGRRLGCSAAAVARRRKLLGIPAHDPQPMRLRGDGYVSLSPERLRVRRLVRRLSQRQVAERAGLSVPHYHGLERGVIKRSRRGTAERTAAALGCRMRDIVRSG